MKLSERSCQEPIHSQLVSPNHQIIMDFQAPFEQYLENEKNITSPIWIWFNKTDNGSVCAICKTPQKSGSTGSLVNHLKRHHGLMSKHNAWKGF